MLVVIAIIHFINVYYNIFLVMLDLWMQMGGIQSLKTTKEAADDREKVKVYVAQAVGSWITKSLNSHRVW